VFHPVTKDKKDDDEFRAVLVDPIVEQREQLKGSLNETSILGIGLEPFSKVKLDETTRVYE